MSNQNQFQMDVQNVLEQFNNTRDPIVIYKAGCVPVVCDFDYAQEVLSGEARRREDCIVMDYLAYNGDGGYVIKALKGVNPDRLAGYTRWSRAGLAEQANYPDESKEYFFYCKAVYQTAEVMYRMENKKAA